MTEIRLQRTKNQMIPQDIIGKVEDAVDADELLNLTSDLVKINSVWDPVGGTSEQIAADYVADWADEPAGGSTTPMPRPKISSTAVGCRANSTRHIP